MATFLSRRYMRKLAEVGRTETVVGVFLLLLLMGLVAAYAVQSTTDAESLFSVDAAALPDDEPRDLAVARRLLPALRDGGWRMHDPEVVSEDELGVVGDGPGDFSVVRVVRRRYEKADGSGWTVSARVCDMATPAQAFGLARARRPEDSEAFSIGQDGWRTATGAGFWNGRYYTELQTSGAHAGAGVALTNVSAAIAAAQLRVGRPFWAEGILPPQGRVPGSLRYVHRRAFGVAFLDEVFAVDLAGGTTAWVTDAGGPSRAEELVDRLVSDAESGAGAGAGAGAEHGTEREGPLAMFPFRGGTMATFAAGRHVHGAWGGDRASVVAAAMSAHHGVASAVQTAGGETAGSETVAAGGDNPFPEPGVAGWRAPVRVSRFTPETLYEKINGRAGLYLQFHVVGLTFGTYTHETDRERTADVYWYDMGEPENGLGIFRSEAPVDATRVAIGQEGYEIGGAVFFLKGSQYVQVLPGGEADADGQTAMEIARGIGSGIEGGGASMWALEVLPEAGRVADSFEYLADDAFSLDFLKDVFRAEYDVDGGRIEMFIHRAEDEAVARALFEAYLGYFEEYGRVVWTTTDGPARIAAGDASGVIDVVFLKGRYVGGVAGADDLERAKKAAVRFCEGLAAPQDP